MGLGLSNRRLEQLHREHGRVLYALACRVLGDSVEAEDAIQEVFLRAHRRFRLFVGSNHFPWLYRITLNVCIEMLRARRRRASLGHDVDEMPAWGQSGIEARLVARAHLEHVCQTLDARDLEIVIAHFVHGLDQGEVADNLGISRRAVVKRLTRLRDTSVAVEKLVGG